MLRRALRSLLTLLLALPLAAQAPRPEGDGPHVLWEGRQAQVLRLRDGKVDASPLPANRELALEGLPALRLDPAGIEPPPSEHPLPPRLLALSDLHGNWAGAVELLRAHGVMDAQFRWTFGRGHLVIVGDVADRGAGVTELYWLIRSLETQAAKAKGRVHLLLGNHDAMLLRGDHRDVNPKYLQAWNGQPGGLIGLFGPQSELGRWLRSRNVAVRIGSFLFVHGGVSTELLAQGLSLPALNARFRQELEAPERPFLLTTKGPVWYRGLIPGADPGRTADATTGEVDLALSAFGAKAMVVGHTTLPQVTSHHGGRVLGIDAGLKRGASGEGLYLDRGRPFRALPDGRREPL